VSDLERSGSSIPTDALAEALQAAVEPMPEFLQARITSNRMLYVLERTAPKLYEAWAESRVDVVAEALFNRDHVRVLWTDAPARERTRYEALARRSLGLGDRS
jgi:hypothetical protein